MRLSLWVLLLGAECLGTAALGTEAGALARKGGFKASSLVNYRTPLTRNNTHVLGEVTGARVDSVQEIRKSESISGVMVAILILVPLLACLLFVLVYTLADDEVVQPVPRSKNEAMKEPRSSSAPGSRASSAMSGSSQSLIPLSGYSTDSIVRQSDWQELPNAAGAHTLYANFVVFQREGLRLSVPQGLQPTLQNKTLDITSITDGGRIVARAVVAERQDPGILLETTGHKAIAFLDTTFALPGNGRSDSRCVILRPVAGGTWDNAGAPFAVFFLSRGAKGATLVARSGDAPGRSRPLLSAQLNAQGMLQQLTGGNQQVLAVSEPVNAQSTESIVNVYQGADASLVLCAMLAAQKLR